MYQPHTIDARHMAEWIDDELNEMRPYASSSTEDKRLLVSLAGGAVVYHGQLVVYISRDLARAVEVYNGIASLPGEQPPRDCEPVAVTEEAQYQPSNVFVLEGSSERVSTKGDR